MQQKSILPPSWEVPQEFRDRLGSSVGRQRAMFADDHLLLVLHAPPKPNDEDREGRFFWRKPDGTWVSNTLGAGPTALMKHVEEYDARIESLDSQAEQARSSADHFAVIEALSPLQRAARNLHAVLQEARKLCPEDRGVIDVRDQAYTIERTAELLSSHARSALDFAIARRAEEQAQSSRHMANAAHRLNLLAAFFFPLATLCAIFGMDVQHDLDNVQPPFLFFGIILAGLLFGVVLTVIVMRRPVHNK
jgi:Mg2+ and Co2+ transporter CorA